MPYEDPDPTDPMTLHGVAVETEDTNAVRDMAECFIDEYLRMGFERQRIEKMFRTPAYAGPYMAQQTMGAAAVTALIDECVARWGGRQRIEQVDRNPDGEIMLAVLE